VVKVNLPRCSSPKNSLAMSLQWKGLSHMTAPPYGIKQIASPFSISCPTSPVRRQLTLQLSDRVWLRLAPISSRSGPILYYAHSALIPVSSKSPQRLRERDSDAFSDLIRGNECGIFPKIVTVLTFSRPHLAFFSFEGQVAGKFVFPLL